MYERIKRLYSEGRLDEAGVQNAVTRGWITQEQADEIINGAGGGADEADQDKE